MTRWSLIVTVAFAMAGIIAKSTPASDAPLPDPDSAVKANPPAASKLEQVKELIVAADHLEAAGAAVLAQQARHRAGSLLEQEAARLAREQAELEELSRALKPAQILMSVVMAEAPNLRGDDLAQEIQRAGGVPIGHASPGSEDAAFAAHLDNGIDGSDLLRSLAAADGELRILSRPQVLALDGTEAQIQVGEVVPVMVGVTFSKDGGVVIPQFSQEHTGIRLSVTPTVAGDGRLQMDIVAERSCLGWDGGPPLFTDPRSGESLVSPIKDTTSAKFAFEIPKGRALFWSVPCQSQPTLLLLLKPRVIPWSGIEGVD